MSGCGDSTDGDSSGRNSTTGGDATRGETSEERAPVDAPVVKMGYAPEVSALPAHAAA